MNPSRGHHDKDFAALDELIKEITVNAYGNDEKLWAFRHAFKDNVTLPADGFVIGWKYLWERISCKKKYMCRSYFK